MSGNAIILSLFVAVGIVFVFFCIISGWLDGDD
jgi:hypothetical protein